MPLAPFMVSAILEEDDMSAESMFMTLLSAINDYDQAHDDDEQYLKAMDECRGVIQYLWAITHDIIPPITQGAVLHPAIIAFYEDLHKEVIASPDTTMGPQAGAMPSDVVMQNVASGLTQVVATLENQRSDRQEREDEKKNSFKKLPEHVQQMYLFAASKDGDTFPAELSEEGTKFFASKSSGAGKTYLQHVLKKKCGCLVVLPQLIVTAILAGQLLWDRMDAPNNFSAFFLPKPIPLRSSATDDDEDEDSALRLHVKSTEGGGLDDADIKKALSQRITWPTKPDELSHQIQNTACALAVPTSDKAMVVLNLLTWIEHVNTNQLIYETQQAEDNLFLGKILLQIDRSLQQWLGQCASATVRSDVDDSLIDFTSLQQEVLMQRFDIKVPAFLNKKESRGKKRKSEEGSSGDRAKPVENREQVPEWKLKRGEDYRTVFHSKIDSIPTIGDLSACGRFHVKGRCFSDCKYSHKKIRGPKVQEMSGWVTACRETAGQE